MLGVLCASIGSIMVTEAIKLITGIGETLLGRLMVYDALEMTYRTLKLRKDPNGRPRSPSSSTTRPSAGRSARRPPRRRRDSTISVRELKALLDARDKGETDFLLVDVREPNEYEIVSIPGSVLIPKNEFLIGDGLAQLPQDKPVILYCKVGSRSAEVLAVLKAAGLSDAQHVGGGVLAWVNQIEPSKPVY